MSAPNPHFVPDDAVAPSVGALQGAKRDAQSITRDWQLLREPIVGVDVREVKNVLKDNGYLTEIWREDWGLRPSTVAQVFQALIESRGLYAWHDHGHATDRLVAH